MSSVSFFLFSAGNQVYLPLIVTVVAVFIWRWWRFTVLPARYPDKPKPLPYWIPFLGHAIAFFRNSYGIFEYADKYFGKTKEPYEVTLAGEKMYIITSPQDVSLIYKKTASVSWDNFIRGMFSWIGISPPSVENMFQKPSQDFKYSITKTKVKARSAQNMVAEFHREQLLQADQLEELSQKLNSYSSKALDLHFMQTKPPYILDVDQDSATISLWSCSTYMFINGMGNAYYGETLSKIEPNLVSLHLCWEETNWKYVYQLPRFMSRDMHSAKDKIIGALRKYFELQRNQRSDGNGWVKAVEDELLQVNLSIDEVARVHMLHYWALNGNAHTIFFWVVAYLAHDPATLEKIRREVIKSVTNGTIDTKYLMDNCPRLEAVFYEVMRLVMASTMTREVVLPLSLGGKVLEPGTKLIVPIRQLHLDPEVWGPNATEFDATRFLGNKLSQSPSFKPFGGGHTLCPGRFLARSSIFSAVATLLIRYDVTLKSENPWSGDSKVGQPFPRINDSKPGIGSLRPVKGDDVILTLKVRK